MLGCFILLAAFGLVSGAGDRDPEGYVPPLVSNGELNCPVDRTFGVRAEEIKYYSQGIFIAGRRGESPEGNLPSRGRWMKRLLVDGKDPGLPTKWTQRLDIRTGVVTCEIAYPSGLVFTGEVFVPFGANVFCIRGTVESKATEPHDITLGMDYIPPNHYRYQVLNADPRQWRYRYFGIKVFDGETRTYGEDLKRTLAPGEKAIGTWQIEFEDDWWHPTGVRRDFETHLAANRKIWDDYYAESSVIVPDEALQNLHDMAAYHLRINATRWGFPVGILPSHWHGTYFGFDAMYMHQGLLADGHFETARREPLFRFRTIGGALTRMRYINSDFTHYGARYPWVSTEDGIREPSGGGIWLDHIFHMATISRSAWTQYLMERDEKFLREVAYPIMLESARFYRYNRIYEDSNGDTYVGKCCDLERLGPSRDHPFLTTVGVIDVFRNVACAGEILATNRAELAEFRACADRLERHLPQEDGRYIAYLPRKAMAGRGPERLQESMATLGGLFPFPIFDGTNPLQVKAADHFFEYGRTSGNMYPVGNSICPWYAGTMSAAMSRLGNRVEPVRWLREAASAAGLFGEFWEINEPGARMHPWFATAAGNCLNALDRMLVNDVGGIIRIGYAVPTDWKDYSFRLPSEAGVSTEVVVSGGRLTRFALTRRVAEGPFRFAFRPEILEGVDPAAFGLTVESHANECVILKHP